MICFISLLSGLLFVGVEILCSALYLTITLPPLPPPSPPPSLSLPLPFPPLPFPPIHQVENMSYFECDLGTKYYPFGQGGRDNLLR